MNNMNLDDEELKVTKGKTSNGYEWRFENE